MFTGENSYLPTSRTFRVPLNTTWRKAPNYRELRAAMNPGEFDLLEKYRDQAIPFEMKRRVRTFMKQGRRSEAAQKRREMFLNLSSEQVRGKLEELDQILGNKTPVARMSEADLRLALQEREDLAAILGSQRKSITSAEEAARHDKEREELERGLANYLKGVEIGQSPIPQLQILSQQQNDENERANEFFQSGFFERGRMTNKKRADYFYDYFGGFPLTYRDAPFDPNRLNFNDWINLARENLTKKKELPEDVREGLTAYTPMKREGLASAPRGPPRFEIMSPDRFETPPQRSAASTSGTPASARPGYVPTPPNTTEVLSVGTPERGANIRSFRQATRKYFGKKK